ncbi:MAG: alpha/beta hydrolase [Kiritimatiellaeota bacterium]|nr:alpha/beta hydrolase [Kiritimatiellota bacterium]
MKHKLPPLILLSGMGADERVFAGQCKAIPQLRVPKWITPAAGESIARYAERLAAHIDPGEPCFFGGASFGGFVALEMVRHLDVLACFLVGSARSAAEFPRTFRALRKMAFATGAIPFEVASLLSKAALLSSGALTGKHAAALLAQMAESDAAFLRWACRAVLEWDGPATPIRVPIFQIHGAQDLVLPAANTCADEIVAGAGHALSISHPQAVTDFLVRKMDIILQHR